MKYRSEILNVADEQAFQQLAEKLAVQDSLPDIVVNNAGIAYLDTFANTSSELWHRIFDVNVMGVVHGSRLFINYRQHASKAGHLVNIASGASC